VTVSDDTVGAEPAVSGAAVPDAAATDATATDATATDATATDATATETAPPPTLAAIVRAQTGFPWSKAKRLCVEGRVTVDGTRWLDPAARVSPGAKVAVDAQGPKHRAAPLQRDAILHADRDLVVVDKPAGLLTVADEAGNRDTLVDHLRTLLRQEGTKGRDGRDTHDDGPLGVVHRLDRDTSGAMVFTRSAIAKQGLQVQFRDHTVERVYHAIVHGTLRATRFETWLLLDRGDGMRGSFGHYRRSAGEPPPEAKRAVTHVAPLVALRDATLIECRLETGRQHQIRIHLAEAGHPLVGETVYVRDYRGAWIEAARPMLHAQVLGFTHPRSRARMRFEAGLPEDFRDLLEALRL